jgi:hypothetical protein
LPVPSRSRLRSGRTVAFTDEDEEESKRSHSVELEVTAGFPDSWGGAFLPRIRAAWTGKRMKRRRRALEQVEADGLLPEQLATRLEDENDDVDRLLEDVLKAAGTTPLEAN